MNCVIKINVFDKVRYLKYDDKNKNFPYMLYPDITKASTFETKAEAEKMIKKYKKEAGTFLNETLEIEVLKNEEEN